MRGNTRISGGFCWAMLTLSAAAVQAQSICSSFPGAAMTASSRDAQNGSFGQRWGGMMNLGSSLDNLSLFGPLLPFDELYTKKAFRFTAWVSDPDSLGTRADVTVELRYRTPAGLVGDVVGIETNKDAKWPGTVDFSKDFTHTFQQEGRIYFVQVTVRRSDPKLQAGMIGYQVCSRDAS